MFWLKKYKEKKDTYAPYSNDNEESLVLKQGWLLFTHHCQILMKEFMLLKQVEEAVCFMNKNHPLFKQKMWEQNIRKKGDCEETV